MQNYKANQIDYVIEAEKEELIVFSEVFYDKGWKAFVDDVETSHIRVNYVLRALKGPGTHKITFKYDLPIYNTASINFIFKFFSDHPFTFYGAAL